MKILYGLGNPGADDRASRHNAGWSIVEAFHRRAGFAPAEDHAASEVRIARGRIAAQDVLLCWPMRFMNDQGICLRRVLDREGAGSADALLVVHDDLDLPLGSFRLRSRGSPPSHNGLASIVSALGNDAFLRLRVGIETRPTRSAVPGAVFVLDDFTDSERLLFERVTDRALDVLDAWVADDLARAYQIAP